MRLFCLHFVSCTLPQFIYLPFNAIESCIAFSPVKKGEKSVKAAAPANEL